MKIMKTIIMGAIFAMLLFSGLLFAPLSVNSYSVTPETLTPGQEGVIQITLENTQPGGATTTGDEVEDVNVYFSSAPGIEFKTSSPVRVGTIEGGTTAIASIVFRVLPDAKGGILSPAFSISQQDLATKQNFVVPVEVSNPPILTLSLDKQTIRSTDTLNLKITNSGGAASKLTIKLNESGKFSLINKDQVFVGDVLDSSSASLDIDARNAKEGINQLQLVVSYQDESGNAKTESKTISVTVKKESDDLAFTQESLIVTSKDNILKLKIKNTGRLLRSFRIDVSDEKIKSKESAEIKLGDFGAGEEKTAEIKVFADVEPGVVDTEITLKWIEGNVEKEEQAIVPLTVSSDADVGIFLDSKPTPLVTGGEHTLSILVSNIGSYKIENVEVALQESDVLEILNAQKSQYIGGLESDDFSTVQYKIKMKELSPGSYPLDIEVKYKDASGIWIDKTVASEIVVRASEKGNVSLLPFAGIAIIIALLYLYWREKTRHHAVK